MGRTLRLLVTSAGRRVELLRCFRASAEALGQSLELLACDLNPDWSAARCSADEVFRAPAATDDSYVDFLLDLCRRRDVAIVVPTIDTELLPLSEARDRFASIGTMVSVSAPALVEIARDKLRTAELLAANGIRVPRTGAVEDVLASPDAWAWPLLLKPRHGSAGRSVRIVASPDDVAAHVQTEPFILQELLRGDEYTINMFFDAGGALRTAIPHLRVQIRAGEVEKGVTRRDSRLTDMARQLAAVLPGPRGVLCFQAMIGTDGRPAVFEINARFGGGYPLAHHAGATFTQWLLEETMGACSAHDRWRADVRMVRYDAAVFDDGVTMGVS